MKKLITMAMLLACIHAVAQDWQLSDTVSLKVRDGLPNFINRLSSGQVNIGFIGGSITVASGWRTNIIDHIQDQYNVAVNEYNVAISGTNSRYGVFRIDRHLLQNDLDLIFIEFAVNDSPGTSVDVERSMEGMIRKIWAKNPLTDICLVHTVKEDYLTDIAQGKMPLSSTKHDVLAQHYGIPTVFWGTKIYDLVQSPDVVFTGQVTDPNNSTDASGRKVFTKDGVHPTLWGQKQYSDYLAAVMDQLNGTQGPHQISSPLIPAHYQGAKMIAVHQAYNQGMNFIDQTGQLSFLDPWIVAGSNFVISEDSQDHYSFEFTGNRLGFNLLKGPSGGNFIVEVDGQLFEEMNFDPYSDKYRVVNFFIGVNNGYHNVKIYPSEDPLTLAEKQQILNEDRRDDLLNNPEKYQGNNLIFSDIFMIGNLNVLSENAPVLSAMGNEVLTEGDIISIPISATDPDEDTMTITQMDLPSNIGNLTDHGDGTATLDLSPSAGTAGDYQVTVIVTDVTNRTDEETITITVLEPGTGLLGTYYRNMELIEPFTLTRVDPTVDFVWPTGERPDPGLGSNNFSIRWEGLVEPKYSEPYTFYAHTDDGVRLYVNGQQLVDQWVNQGPTERSGTLTLEAGQQYVIVMEYYENGGSATAQLSWSSPSQLKEVIPQSQLFEPIQGFVGQHTPGLAVIGNQILAEGDVMFIPISASDPDNDALTITQIDLPVNIGNLTDHGEGIATLELSPSIGTAGSYQVTVTVTDETNRTDDETITITVLEPYTGGGTGLLGTYYRNKDLVEPFTLTRVDPNVDFYWPTGARPDSSLGSNNFSIRWEGLVEPQHSEPYTFYTNTDDGVRLYVNGQQLVDQWVNQGPTERSGTLALEAGQKYSIIMEYYENGGNATAQLLWSSPSQPKEIIPQNFLFEPDIPLQSSYNRLVGGFGAIEASHYLVYPNPVLDHINIEFSLMEAETIDVLLLNSLGQLYDLGQFEMEKGTSIVLLNLDRFSLPSGLYYLNISSGQILQKITKLYLTQ